MEIFSKDDVQTLLRNKFIVVIGDSVMRAVYKDIVLLLQENTVLQKNMLKAKGEASHCNDMLIEISDMTNGKWFREVRQYKTDYHLVRFYFVTCCHSEYMETILADLSTEPLADVIVMNSCLWDVSRYGPRSMQLYRENLAQLFSRLFEMLPPSCLFIWSTAMPIADMPRGGVIVQEMSCRVPLLRLDVVEGNFYAKQAAEKAKYNVLDLHFYFRTQLHMRARDGVHWNGQGHRRISNLLLKHVCGAWGVALPRQNMMEMPLQNLPICRNAPERPIQHRQRSLSCHPQLLNQVVTPRPPLLLMQRPVNQFLRKLHDIGAYWMQQQKQCGNLPTQQTMGVGRAPSHMPHAKLAQHRYHPYARRYC